MRRDHYCVFIGILQISEALQAMEGGVVGIVEVCRLVEGGAAQIDQILPVKQKIHILKSHLLRIAMAVIQKIGYCFPMCQILGADQ